jgi:hypothetical protein
MLVEPPRTGSGSSRRHPDALPGRRFLTSPDADPLGLAAEIYYARTGRLDYNDLLGAPTLPAHHAGTGEHPFEGCYVAQGRFNARVEWVREQVRLEGGDPTPYRLCRDRWHCNTAGASPVVRKTSACMSIWCPGCWITKLERAYLVVAATRAPVLGVIATDWLGLGRGHQEILTPDARETLTAPGRRLSARDRQKIWHPLYWSLFPIPGVEPPGYRFVGVYVAASPLRRKPAFPRTPEELREFGVPRSLAVSCRCRGPSEVLAWEQSFTGPQRLTAAWQAFRGLTPAPVMSSSEDGSSPGDTIGDALRAERKTVTWAQTQRAYADNATRFADIDQEDAVLNEPGLLDIEKTYADARLAHQLFLKQVTEARKASKPTP